MKYTVLISRSFQKKFKQLQKNMQKLIREALKELENDPYTSRVNCDIKLLKDTKPKKYRLRIGTFRAIYVVEQKDVKIIDLLKRETGYGKLD